MSDQAAPQIQRRGPSIEAVNIEYSVRHRTILAGVDIEANHGELVGLVGPNGAGKSTLLGVLAGDITPSSGEVFIDGRSLLGIASKELARKRSVVTQSFQISFPFTVREVVAMGRNPWPSSAVEDAHSIDAALAECGIDHLQHQPLPTLSGGERARVAFARALAQDTPTLLLDEPTAALDIGHQEALLSSARSRTEAGSTIICVLHDLNLAAAYCDRVALMEEGSISHCGTPGSVFTDEILSRAYGHPISVVEQDNTGHLIVPQRQIGRKPAFN